MQGFRALGPPLRSFSHHAHRGVRSPGRDPLASRPGPSTAPGLVPRSGLGLPALGLPFIWPVLNPESRGWGAWTKGLHGHLGEAAWGAQVPGAGPSSGLSVVVWVPVGLDWGGVVTVFRLLISMGFSLAEAKDVDEKDQTLGHKRPHHLPPVQRVSHRRDHGDRVSAHMYVHVQGILEHGL